LRTQASELIAMLVPDVANPFYTGIVRAVEDVARAKGYAVMLCNTDEDPAKEAEYLRAVVGEPVAGIIGVPTSTATPYRLAATRGVPVVAIDRTPGADDRVDAVVIDGLTGAAASTRVLFERGYRRVACISGPAGIETADRRAEGWRQGVREATGAEAPDELLVRRPYTIGGGRDAAAALLALPEPPDAIFCANNRLAVGALRQLADAGKAPPEVGVYSFGELPLITWRPDGIFVAHMPMREMGTLAAQMLLERIGGLDTPARRVTLAPHVETEPGDLSFE
ncbi:MAG: substrate-binding domain-containing protein, partial [Propionibacteriaceae bacterium]|nr:substrate-binding domain-containing protein [Propionibacteriaceae bacterium]